MAGSAKVLPVGFREGSAENPISVLALLDSSDSDSPSAPPSQASGSRRHKRQRCVASTATAPAAADAAVNHHGAYEVVNHVTRERAMHPAPFTSYATAYRTMFSKKAMGRTKFPYRGQGATPYCAFYAVLNAVEVAQQRPFTSAEWKARRTWAQRNGLSIGSFIHFTIPHYVGEGFAASDGVEFDLLIDPAKTRRKTRRSARGPADLECGASVAALTAALRKRTCVLMLQNVDWITTDDWLVKPMKAGAAGRGSMGSDRGGHAVCAIGLCHVCPKNWPLGKDTLHVVLRDSNPHCASTQTAAMPMRGIAFISCADLCAEPDRQLDASLAKGRGVLDGELAITDALGLFVSGLATVGVAEDVGGSGGR